ncbi:hypothetical protein RRG08_059343 [Elysia crispata]|uniref:Uncharacterized protein n=1 Tax=Elysia crispata TaxID=231223 RepID=A0AAE1EGQ0_9GAST|nr:hypothetical protein RRG08_059343 [Elysia crispata]
MPEPGESCLERDDHSGPLEHPSKLCVVWTLDGGKVTEGQSCHFSSRMRNQQQATPKTPTDDGRFAREPRINVPRPDPEDFAIAGRIRGQNNLNMPGSFRRREAIACDICLPTATQSNLEISSLW